MVSRDLVGRCPETWSTFLCEDDRCWHEMLLDDIDVHLTTSALVRTSENIECAGAVDEFVAKVQAAAAAGWNPAEPIQR